MEQHITRALEEMSIRKLFASDRGLFANGGKSIMMGTHCLHCQSQRRADGSQAQVDTRKHDSLETFWANACLTSDNWGSPPPMRIRVFLAFKPSPHAPIP